MSIFYWYYNYYEEDSVKLNTVPFNPEFDEYVIKLETNSTSVDYYNQHDPFTKRSLNFSTDYIYYNNITDFLSRYNRHNKNLIILICTNKNSRLKKLLGSYNVD